MTASTITSGIDALEGQKVPPNLTVHDSIVPAANIQDQYSPSQQEQQQMNLLMFNNLLTAVADTASSG